MISNASINVQTWACKVLWFQLMTLAHYVNFHNCIWQLIVQLCVCCYVCRVISNLLIALTYVVSEWVDYLCKSYLWPDLQKPDMQYRSNVMLHLLASIFLDSRCYSLNKYSHRFYESWGWCQRLNWFVAQVINSSSLLKLNHSLELVSWYQVFILNISVVIRLDSKTRNTLVYMHSYGN